jgi:predicted nucleic acid-binding protein
MADPERRCWDSVCCLGWLKGEPDKIPACQSVLDLVDDGKVEIVVSTLAIAEVLWLKGHDKIPPDNKEKVRAFFRRSSFLIAGVDLATAELAQELVWNHGVHPKDAVHVATALLLRCVSLDTFDTNLWKLNGVLGEGLKLRIGKPEGGPQGSIFDVEP